MAYKTKVRSSLLISAKTPAQALSKIKKWSIRQKTPIEVYAIEPPLIRVKQDFKGKPIIQKQSGFKSYEVSYFID